MIPEADGEGLAVRPQPMAENISMPTALHDTMEEFNCEAVFVVTVGESEGETTLDVTGFEIYRDLFGDALLVEPRTDMSGRYIGLGYDSGRFTGERSAYADMVADELLDEATANYRLVESTLTRYEESLDKRVFAHSPAITEQNLHDHPSAFFKMSRRSRVLGKMYPGNIRDMKSWELPSTFPEVLTADGETVTLV